MEYPCTKIYLIRHGDTIDEETRKVYKGSINIPLSDRGRARIAEVGRFLSSFHFDRFYTSMLSRCVETGAIISGFHGQTASADMGLNEISFGEWEGLSFDDIKDKFPERFDAWLEDPIRHTPPGGEPLADARTRIMRTFHAIIDRNRGGTIAVISHAGVLKIILSTLLSVDLRRMHVFAQDYGCIDVLDLYDDNIPVIRLLNYGLHLQENL